MFDYKWGATLTLFLMLSLSWNGFPLQGNEDSDAIMKIKQNNIELATTIQSSSSEPSTVFVDSLVDSDGFTDPSNCATQTGCCTWRSALSFCRDRLVQQAVSCTISLPSRGTIIVNSSFTSTQDSQDIVVRAPAADMSLSIVGNGASVRFLANTEGAYRQSFLRVSVVDNPGSYGITVSIANITVVGFGGNATVGGAVYLQGIRRATITDARFSSNLGRSGGAIYLNGSTNVKVLRSRFEGNRARLDGGAIAIRSAATSTTPSLVASAAVAGRAGGSRLSEGDSEAPVAAPLGPVDPEIVIKPLSSAAPTRKPSPRPSMAPTFEPSWSPLPTDVTVTIDRCDVISNVAGQAGGGVYVTSASAVTVRSSRVTANKGAVGGGLTLRNRVRHVSVLNCNFNLNSGSAVYMSNDISYVNIVHTNFSYNSATNGAGIALLSNVSNVGIISANLSGNVAAYGGGIYMASEVSHVVISSSEISYNQATVFGGGVYGKVEVSDLKIDASNIKSNFAGSGGGLYLTSTVSNINISKSNISRNVVTDNGAGVCLQLDVTDVRFTSTNVTDNTAVSNMAGAGGGLFLYNLVTQVSFLSCNLSGNYAMVGGGGLYATHLVSGLTFSGLLLSSNYGSQGGGMFFSDTVSDIRIFSSRVTANTASDAGAGLCFTGASNVQIMNSQLLRNVGKTLGGGVHFDSSSNIVISGCSVVGNIASDGAGISFYYRTHAASVTASNITDNIATYTGGGVHLLYFVTDVAFLRNNVSANTAGTYGGAVFMESSVSLISLAYCLIAGNSAATGGGVAARTTVVGVSLLGCRIANNSGTNGGGLAFLDTVRNVRIQSTFLGNNVASGSGGGFYFNNRVRNITLSRTRLVSNSVTAAGGGGYIANSCFKLYFYGCEFASNSALHDSGGGLYILNLVNTVYISNSSFVTNSADKYGGAIFISTAFYSLAILKTSFRNNSAGLDGGAVFVQSNASDLGISGSAFSRNTALQGSGGAIAVESHVSNVRVTDCQFKLNSASRDGGAVYLLQTVTRIAIFRTAFSNNTALHGHGGGLYMSTDISGITISRSNFSTNGACTHGGGVFAKDHIVGLSVSHCVVTSNTALLGSGGGIFLSSHVNATSIASTLLSQNSAFENGGGLVSSDSVFGFSLADSTLLSNSALHGSGGGIFVYSGATGVTVAGCTISSNSANTLGGGVLVVLSVTSVNVSDCQIFDNTAAFGGGVLAANNVLNLHFSNCIFYSNIGNTYGGGLFLSLGVELVRVDRCILAYNSARNGSGLAAVQGVTDLWISNSSFLGNTASESGGGLALMEVIGVRLTSLDIAYNSAVQYGGGTALSSVFMVTTTDCVYEGNAAATGGAVAVLEDCYSLDWQRVIMSGNTARANGGAVSLGANNFNISLVSCDFVSNAAAAGDGGAVFSDQGNSRIIVTYSSFESNSASNIGGGIVITSNTSDVKLLSSVFDSNSATYGGALAVVLSVSHVTVTSAVFTDNSASYGGGIYVGYNCSDVLLSHLTLSDNKADVWGGGLFLGSDNFRIASAFCSFSGNTAPAGGGVYATQRNKIVDIHGCWFTSNSADYGSCVYSNILNIVSVSSTIFQKNIGAAIFISVNNALTVFNGSFTDNEGFKGACVYSEQDNLLNISNSAFEHSQAVDGDGGAVWMGGYHRSVSIRRSRFLHNVAVAGDGGAIAVTGIGNEGILFAENEFVGNAATGSGGSLFLSQSGSVAVQGCSFSGGKAGWDQLTTLAASVTTTTAPDTFGGGAYVTDCADVSIHDTVFDHNTAYSGGGLYAQKASSFTVSNSSFLGNVATAYGSALLLTYVSDFSLTGSQIQGAANGSTDAALLCWNSSTMSEPKNLGRNNWKSTDLVSLLGTTLYAVQSAPVIQPQRLAADTPLRPIEVRALDFYGKVLTSYSGTVSLSTQFSGCGDYSGFLSTDARMVNGIANFTGLSLKCKPQGAYVITFSLLDTVYKCSTSVVLSTFTPTSAPTSAPTQTSSPTHAVVTLVTSEQKVRLSGGEQAGVAVGVAALLGLLLAWWLYVCVFSAKAKQKIARKNKLSQLPLHQCLYGDGPLQSLSDSELVHWIGEHQHFARERDFDGRTPLGIVFAGLNKRSVTVDIVYSLLLEGLPSPGDVEEGQSDARGGEAEGDWDWFAAINRDDDLTVAAVKRVIKVNKQRVYLLANATDSSGRTSRNLAGPRCKEAILSALYLHGKYEIRDGPPEHVSATSLVVIATEHMAPTNTPTNTDGAPSTRLVALKFMHHEDQFTREIQSRVLGGFSPQLVLPILCSFDGESAGEEDYNFRDDAIIKGYEDYPYCIVMEAASQSLKRLIDHGRIVGSDWDAIKGFIKQLAASLDHMHEKGFVHGDVKPLNILQVDRHLKLTDLDAVVSWRAGDCVGVKLSSGYAPPEMLWESDSGAVALRCLNPTQTALPSTFAPLPADPSYDMWALGCVLYLLCTGSALFRLNVDDNISNQEDLHTLYQWTDSAKEERLKEIADKHAQNLVSLLLNKNPKKRMSASRVLEHPFVTNRPATRMVGEEASWDVFLSYRVDSDGLHAEALYEALTGEGLRVWWDKRCLSPGQPWELGFCKGLVCSAHFVCLLSRGAIKNDTKDWQNFEKLETTSRCDNVLLEWRLALELKERGMIAGVYPVFIGDLDSASGLYSNYFDAGCHPALPDVVVDAVEGKAREHLHREGLGLPLRDRDTVRSIVNTITANQGGFWLGDGDTAIDEQARIICRMAKPSDDASTSVSLADPDVQVEVVLLEEENEDLRSLADALQAKIVELQRENASLLLRNSDLFDLTVRIRESSELHNTDF